MSTKGLLAGARWRKSSFSGGGDAGNGACIEAARLPGGRIAIRDSKNPDRAVVLVASTQLAAFIDGIKARDFE